MPTVLKIFIRYLLTIVASAFLTTSIVQTYAHFFVEPINRRHFVSTFLPLLLFELFVYSIYLIIYSSGRRKEKVFLQSIVCFLIAFIVPALFTEIFWRLDWQFVYNLLFVSIGSVSIPYLHYYLTILLNIDDAKNWM
jgi:hypothetical protein